MAVSLSDGLLSLISEGNAAVAAWLCASLPREVLARSQVDVSLNADTPIRRLAGLAHLVTEHGYAGYPGMAIELRDAIVTSGVETLCDMAKANPTQRANFTGSVCSSGARAALQLGQFDRAWSLAEEGERLRLGQEANLTDVWMENVKYEILIRRLQIPDAVAFKAARSAYAGAPSDGRIELDNMLQDYVPDETDDETFRPAETFSWNDQTYRMLSNWIIEQTKADAASEASYAEIHMAAEARASVAVHFETMRRAREDVRDAIEGRVGNRSRDDIVQTSLFYHQVAARAILFPSSARRGTLIEYNHDLNQAAQTIGLRSPAPEDLQTALRATETCRDWSRGIGDKHGLMLALWTHGQAAELLGLPELALESYRALFAELVIIRPKLPSAYGRAILARSYRTLIPRLASLAINAAEPELAFAALEFRRGLGLSDFQNPEQAEPAPIPPGVHYLAVSVFADRGSFIALRAADDLCQVTKLDIDLDQGFALASLIDPAAWRHPMGRGDRSPRAALKALVEPVEVALRSGRIQVGDHVVTAFDHPYYMVPVHYLDINGDLAIKSFTFSRIASFDDLKTLVGKAPVVPVRKVAVFVQPLDATDTVVHENAFARSIKPLGEVQVLAGIEAGTPTIQRWLSDANLVHFHTHGHFPDAFPSQTVDPVAFAGLLVASSGRLPSRSHPEASLLRVRDILSCETIAQDISLSACVSGLGRPGKGEDMLGLEFAFRRRGARTVLASHWHVDVEIAARFFARYYENLLENGRSRAQAWQQSILAAIAEADTTTLACAQCAFSIHGDWR